MNGAASKKAGPGSEDLQRGLCPDTLQPSLRAGGWLHLCSLLVCCHPGRSGTGMGKSSFAARTDGHKGPGKRRLESNGDSAS